jgi:hypothetical protein
MVRGFVAVALAVVLAYVALALFLAGHTQPPADTRVSLSIVPGGGSIPITMSVVARFGGGPSRCSIDGSAWQRCTSPVVYEGLTFGVEHTIKVGGFEETWTSHLETKPRPRGTGLLANWHPFFEP